MSKFLSGRVPELKVGISSYTENKTALEVIGITSTRSLIVTTSATINGLTYPTEDSDFNRVLSTDGAGTIRFINIPGVGGSVDWESTQDFGLITESTLSITDLELIIDVATESYNFGLLTFPTFDIVLGENIDAGLVVGDPVTSTLELGFVNEVSTSDYDFGNFVVSGVVYPNNFVLPAFTVTSLPSVNPAGQMLFVTDETGGSIPAFSDGTNWRRLTDRQIVS
jgi:hypothetical protein